MTDVRQHYEQLPYPPRDPQEERERFAFSRLDFLPLVTHYCHRGVRDLRKGGRFLIAGGGTGDSDVSLGEQLRDYPDCEIISIDLSKASQEVARQRAEVRGLSNIQWITGSLLDLPQMDLGKFDHIVSSGVLHHLEDPVRGLLTLRECLAENGSMGLMVYAWYGRIGIYETQELLRLINKEDDPISAKLDVARSVLDSLPPYN